MWHNLYNIDIVIRNDFLGHASVFFFLYRSNLSPQWWYSKCLILIGQKVFLTAVGQYGYKIVSLHN